MKQSWATGEGTIGVKEQLRLLKHFHLLFCFPFLRELYSQSGINFSITLS